MKNQGKYNKEVAAKLWNPRKAEIKWLYHDQLWSMESIGRYYNVSQTAMGKVIARLGIESRGKGRKGKENGNYKDGTQSRLYRQMIEKDKCEVCGVTIRLVIHHKNGNHQDNHLRNLQVLCESCHNRYHKTLWWKLRKSSASQTPLMG